MRVSIEICDHKPGKHGKPGKLRAFEKLSESQKKTQGNLDFCRKILENSGKMKNMGHDR